MSEDIELASKINENKEVWINHFSEKCFLEAADGEYLIARMAFRAGLYLQFHWSSLHCLEKYLKAILIFNRKSAKNLSHKVSSRIIDEVKKVGIDPLLGVSEKAIDFFNRLEIYGENRYLDHSLHICGSEIEYIDELVSAIRRYCFDIQKFSSIKLGLSDFNAEVVRVRSLTPYQAYECSTNVNRIKFNSPFALEALIWQNKYFSDVEWPPLPFRLAGTNSPFYYMQEGISSSKKLSKIKQAQKDALSELKTLVQSNVFTALNIK